METIKRSENKSILSKVPEVTFYFLLINVLCTTVGETEFDLDVELNVGTLHKT